MLQGFVAVPSRLALRAGMPCPGLCPFPVALLDEGGLTGILRLFLLQGLSGVKRTMDQRGGEQQDEGLAHFAFLCTFEFGLGTVKPFQHWL